MPVHGKLSPQRLSAAAPLRASSRGRSKRLEACNTMAVGSEGGAGNGGDGGEDTHDKR